MEPKIAKLDPKQIEEFLSKIALSKKLNHESIKALASSLVPMFVEGGSILIEEGATDTSMYILYQGRLRVQARSQDQIKGKDLSLAEIAPGEFVGEIALLTLLPRTTTVRAVRDSILLKLDETNYRKFVGIHPEEVVEIATTALKRLAVKTRPTQIGENFVTLAVAPAGNSNHRPFIQRLLEEQNKIKPTFWLTKEICNQHFGKDISQIAYDDAFYIKITEWLQSLENQYGFIIYETDSEMTPWTERCLRQADRLLFVAEHRKSSSLNTIENALFSKANQMRPYIEIAFVHPDDTIDIEGTDKWIKDRVFNGFYHMKLNSTHLFDRFIRFLNGRAIGVVLNGGGARGAAHIGVLKALQELNIPVDFIGGTSMGACVGAGYCAYGVSELTRQLKIYADKLKNEWTLPLMALLKGKYTSEFFMNVWNEKCIEDLWTRFFCISTNLTEAKLKVHDRGSIWLAVRASTSIPAVYPPVYDEEGNLFVDGYVVNNMPVDIMRQMICGGKILAVNCHIKAPDIFKRKFPYRWISGWKLFFQRFNPFYSERIEYDTILNILLASIYLSIEYKQQKMSAQADYLVEVDTHAHDPLDFKHLEDIVEIGYRTAMKRLPELFNINRPEKEQIK